MYRSPSPYPLLVILLMDEAGLLTLAGHASLAKQELLAFSTFLDPTYKTPDHIRLLAWYLEAVERGDIKRLMIFEPPRHGKTRLVSGTFPSWCIGRDPLRQMILTSYSDDRATMSSVMNREIIGKNERWPVVFPDVSLKTDSKDKSMWAVHGQMEQSLMATGIRGGTTGFGAWGFIIDDPVKDYVEASSPTIQERNYLWYKTVSRTRLAPDGWIILIMTRWHEQDLAGKILESDEVDEWTILHLPAESYGRYEDYTDEQRRFIPAAALPDPLSRPKGEPLWGERYSKKFLVSARSALGHEYESLYQGNTGAPEGKKFQRSAFRPVLPARLEELHIVPVERMRSWDLAWSASEAADLTVGLRGTLYKRASGDLPEGKLMPSDAGFPDMFIVLEDLARWQEEWDDYEPKLVKTTVEDGRDYQLIVEAVASQNKAFKSFRRNYRLVNHTIRPFTPESDKEVRAVPAARLVNRGFVFILYENASTGPEWETEFLRELGNFPNAKNDDQVDALSQMVARWLPLFDKFAAEDLKTQADAKKKRRGLLRTRGALPHPFQQNQAGRVLVDQRTWLGRIH